MSGSIEQLEELTKEILGYLPTLESDNSFSFIADEIPSLHENLCTKNLVIKKSGRDCGAWRIDALEVYASRDVYAALGIVTVMVLLDDQVNSLKIHLMHQASEVKSLVIEDIARLYRDDTCPGLITTPERFNYWPEEIYKHPWDTNPPFDPYTLPMFELYNEDQMLVTEEDWRDRDVLVGFGREAGMVRMMQLFLDMSRPDNQTTEIVLESESGFRGVAPCSSEMRFWLPESEFWYDW